MSPRVVAIAGGKGGVGKSLVAANVGIFLATLGKRVVLVDAAFGAANLHIFAGVPRPSRSLSEALAPGGPRLAELAVPTHVPGVKLIGAVNDPPWLAEPPPAVVERIADQLRELPADWVVVDLGPGSAPATLELFLAADVQIVVAVPDPTSIELMHRFAKAAFLRSLERRGLAHLGRAVAREPRLLEGGAPSALEVYLGAVAASGAPGGPLLGHGSGASGTEPGREPASEPRRDAQSEPRRDAHSEPRRDAQSEPRRDAQSEPRRDAQSEIDALREAILGFSPHLVINSARSKSDMELGRAVVSAARRRLGTPFRYLGHLEYDEAVWASTRRRRPLLIEHPETRIAKCFERVARGILAVRPAVVEGDVLPPDSHYELLEVPPTASFEDIRRANRRIRDIYGAESVAISGLYDPASLEAVHRRLDLAYTTLMDAAKRKDYDMELFPDGVPMPVSPPLHADISAPRPVAKVDDPAVIAVRPAMPELSPFTEFSGPLLRQIREAVGVELREIAERSKIGMAYLSALESELFAKLPAAVYVRGFLAEYARALGLDGERVKQTYLARFRAARGHASDGADGADDEDEPRPKS